jgi:hypothetical protein
MVMRLMPREIEALSLASRPSYSAMLLETMLRSRLKQSYTT